MGKAIILNGGSGGLDPDGLNAMPADVLAGKVFGGSGSDDPQTGTMPDRGAPTYTLSINGTQDFPPGRYTGGSIRQNIPVQGGQTINPTNYQQVVSCNGKYMTGDVVVPAVSNLVPQHIKSGVQVGNVVGTFPDYSYLAAGQVVFRNGIFSGLMTEGMQSPNRSSYVYHPQIADGAIDMGIRNGNGWRGGRYFVSKKTIHLGAFSRLVVRYSSTMSNAYDIEYEVRVCSKNYTWGGSFSDYANLPTLVSRSIRTRQEQHNVAIDVDISGINEQCFITIMTTDTYSGGRRIAAKINEIELIN